MTDTGIRGHAGRRRLPRRSWTTRDGERVAPVWVLDKRHAPPFQSPAQPGLQLALDVNRCAVFADMASGPPGEVHDEDDVFWTLSSLPWATFDAVSHSRLGADGLDERIREKQAYYRRSGRGLVWWSTPHTTPPGLVDACWPTDSSTAPASRAWWPTCAGCPSPVGSRSRRTRASSASPTCRRSGTGRAPASSPSTPRRTSWSRPSRCSASWRCATGASGAATWPRSAASPRPAPACC